MARAPDELDQTILSLEAGELLSGRYRLVRELGRGGMGIVWLAEDTTLDGRHVAIKLLPTALTMNARAVARLKKEAKTCLELSHPHIVRLLNFEQDESRGKLAFLVMQYVDGHTLDDLLADHPDGLPLERVLKWAPQIAQALDHAHEKSVLHRDIKPSNIMIDGNDDDAYLMDFGIAREAKDSYARVTGRDSSGTLPYMSPQQFAGENSKSNDIYSLAATLYEALSGEPPFSTGDLQYQILHQKPNTIDHLADGTNAALLQGLAKLPDERPNTAVELASRLAGRSLEAPLQEHSVDSHLSLAIENIASLDSWSVPYLALAEVQALQGDFTASSKSISASLDISVPDGGSSSFAWIPAVASHALAGNVTLAEQLARQLHQGFENRGFSIWMYRAIATCTVRRGEIETALAVAERIPDDVDRREVLSAIAAAQATGDDILGAERTLRLCEPSGDSYGYSFDDRVELARAQVRSGASKALESTVARLREDCEQSASNFGGMCEILALSGALHSALELAEYAEDVSEEEAVNSYCRISLAMAAEKEWSHYADSIHRAKNANLSYDNCTIIATQARLGDIVGAESTVRELVGWLEEELGPASEQDDLDDWAILGDACIHLAAAHVRNGDLRKAFRLVEQEYAFYCDVSDTMLIALSWICSDHGHVRQALECADKIRKGPNEEWYQAQAWWAIGEAAARCGSTEVFANRIIDSTPLVSCYAHIGFARGLRAVRTPYRNRSCIDLHIGLFSPWQNWLGHFTDLNCD